MATKRRLAQALCVVAILSGPFNGFSDDFAIQRELDLIKEQNRVLQEQVKTLTGKVAALESKQDDTESQREYSHNSKTNNVAFPAIKIGVQGGLGWEISNFRTTSAFFVDDVKLSLAARLARKIDFFADVNLNTLDHYNLPFTYVTYSPYGNTLALNEIYLDFRDLLQPFGYDNLLNIRAGQFYIPFGEEYAARYPFDNPLIWRSASDIWGLSPGIEFYGGVGRWSYVLAIQNHSQTDEGGDSDKSVAGRVRFDANKFFNISFSAMRTGNLDGGDRSAVFFDGLTFIGSTGGTNSVAFGHFADHAELLELDPQLKWQNGYLKSSGGVIFRDGQMHRTDWYYSFEALQHLCPKVYVAARASQVLQPGVNHLRLSAGLGYDFNSHLTFKSDFTYDQFRSLFYASTFGGELAFRF